MSFFIKSNFDQRTFYADTETIPQSVKVNNSGSDSEIKNLRHQ